MKKVGKVKKIDFSRKRLSSMADNFYNEGKYLSALKFAYKEASEYGMDIDVFIRLADIYEGMNLQGMALNWWFRCLDSAELDDLPDIYEGIAVNFLAMGQESQAAYYYNKLIDSDDTIPEEVKLDIAEAFSNSPKDKFRFSYPPELVDYSEELKSGAKALKAGNCKSAIEILSSVSKESKQYVQAKEMEAVARLLAGEVKEAEEACQALLAVEPNDVRALATLAAVYLEQGRKEESKALAYRLSEMDSDDADELYKIATVCCENELHEAAYKKFKILDQKTPYDGRVLYFKGVSAYKCGKIECAIEALNELCTIYPDAAVAKYYLAELHRYQNEGGDAPELIYFYHLPQEERENRCSLLIHMSKCAREEAELFAFLAMQENYFEWCFDEMDGGDHELQYLALVAAVKAGIDGFLRRVLLDYEVLDVLKLETLRMLIERNEEMEIGVVLCSIYKRLFLPRISIGRKRRKKFIEAFAKVASKFIVIKETYGERLKRAAEALYRALEGYNSLDLVDNPDDCACAIYMLAGLKELGDNPEVIAAAFEANVDRVKVLLSAAVSNDFGVKKENEDETY